MKYIGEHEYLYGLLGKFKKKKTVLVTELFISEFIQGFILVDLVSSTLWRTAEDWQP